MGNTLSIHTEIFIKRDLEKPALNQIETASKLLERLNGMSYNGSPVIIKDAGTAYDLSYRISYGDKYEPRSLFSFFEECSYYIDKLFARTHYEGGEWDYILTLPNDSMDYEKIRRKCDYGFDEIIFKLKDSSELSSSIESKSLLNNYRKLSALGKMNSISDLIALDETDVISFPIEHERSIKTYAINDFEATQIKVVNEIIEKSIDVIFKYKNKTVHRKIHSSEYIKMGYKDYPIKWIANKYNNGMYDIYSSGWSNCIDSEYLEYIDKIGRNTNTLQ